MKKVLVLLVLLIGSACSKDNGPVAGGKLAGTTWVAEYSTNPATGEILYDRYRFTTDTEAVEEGYYKESKIISSIDHTYKYDPPRLLLTHDVYTYANEVVGNKIKRNQIEYIKQ